jgi:hypothetical protein
MEHLAGQLAAIPGVVAVTLGGSRAAGTAGEDSDWDFGLYNRDRLDPADIIALGWPGRVFAPGEWGDIVNGGAWLTIGGTKVDLIYRNLDEVLHWDRSRRRRAVRDSPRSRLRRGDRHLRLGWGAGSGEGAGQRPAPPGVPAEAASDRACRLVPSRRIWPSGGYLGAARRKRHAKPTRPTRRLPAGEPLEV